MERMLLADQIDLPMPLPPRWCGRQAAPYQVGTSTVPGHFYAVAPYQAYGLGNLVQTVTADSPQELVRLAWLEQHRYELVTGG